MLANGGDRSIDLGGYVIDFGDVGQRSELPSYALAPGDRVRVYTGDGSRGPGLYAGFLYPVLDDDGDTVTVENPNGRIVAGRRYS